MVADDVSVTAVRARDQHGPVVVTLFGDLVLGSVIAGDAGESELVLGDLGRVTLGLCGLLLIGGRGLRFRGG